MALKFSHYIIINGPEIIALVWTQQEWLLNSPVTLLLMDQRLLPWSRHSTLVG